MIPKKIHLCWFSGKDFPVEIKRCIESWGKLLPDYEIRLWSERDARAIGCRFINEALDAKKWAFAADAVRFYAVWKEGGIYMDSDILLLKRFDKYIPENGFVTFHEHIGDKIQLQAAFFMGEKGNSFCRDAYGYYSERPFKKADGSFDLTISPVVMKQVAQSIGWQPEDREQRLKGPAVILPGYLVTPSNRCPLHHPDAFARHTIYGSWRTRKFGRRLELFFKHQLSALSYYSAHIIKPAELPSSK